MRPTHIIAIAGLSTALLGSANAEIESSASVGYHTDYIYRGLNIGEDLVDFSLGFSGSTDVADWNLGLWYGTVGQEGVLDELRVEASASKCISDVFTVSAGIVNHTYINGLVILDQIAILNDRLEPFVGVSTNLGGIALSAKASFNATDDVWAHDVYYEVNASYAVDLGANLSGSLSANYGVWDTDPFFGLVDDIADLTLTGALNYAASDNITLSAYITHSWVDEDDLGSEDETFGGVSLSVGF